MNTNLYELQLLINEYKPAVITLQEVYNPPNTNHSPLNLYNWSYKLSPTNLHHSVAIGVHKSIPFKLIKTNTNLSAIAINIKSPIDKTIVSI